jgi:predicted HTH domain antitoxin
MSAEQPLLELSERLLKQLQVCGLDKMEIRRISRLALAVELFRLKHLTMGLAAELAGLKRHEFMAQLAERHMPIVDLPDAELAREFKTVDVMMGQEG